MQPGLEHALDLLKQRKLAQADAVCAAILEREPAHCEALQLRGIIAGQAGRDDIAARWFDKAASADPKNASAWNNLGLSLTRLRRHAQAIASFDRGIALQPAYAGLHVNRGVALAELGRHAEAVAGFERAVALDPAHPHAELNRANSLRDLRRFPQALDACELALQRQAGMTDAATLRYTLAATMCQWTQRDVLLADLIRRVQLGEPVLPFTLLSAVDDPALHLQAARQIIRLRYPPAAATGAISRREPRQRIRLAYVSTDFRQHPGATLMAELFERHDRARFETYAISLGKSDNSAMRARLERAFDHFVDASALSDAEVAQWMQREQIDIAVDRNGHTKGARTGIFARRCAPVQVNYLAYPGTTGAPYMDYLIADRFIIPAQCRSWYSEQIVSMPHTYQCNDSRRAVAQDMPTRGEVGLPQDGFVFCSFNADHKLTPQMFNVWMRVLQQVPHSVLWLCVATEEGAANLRREAERCGVDPARLVFAARMPHAQHLSRLRLADLMLDTLPYTGHTTTSDALWVGLPVLTSPGQSFAARVAGSLLQAVGLPELVAESLQDFEAMAVRLATQADELQVIRTRLVQTARTSPLFDIAQFTRHIEWAFTTMWERHLAGEAPRHFDVPADAPVSAAPAPPL